MYYSRNRVGVVLKLILIGFALGFLGATIAIHYMEPDKPAEPPVALKAGVLSLNTDYTPEIAPYAPVQVKAPKPKPKNYTVKRMKITFYCACAKCCGKTNGITASGKRVRRGVTVAAPRTYKFGTKLYIKGFGYRTVQDRGGAIKDNRIDIYVPTHAKALKLGLRYANVRIYR